MEKSRTKRCPATARFPLQLLSFQVSHYAQRLIYDEYNRMLEWGADVYDKCDCAYKTTHGLPCACQLADAVSDEAAISAEAIHKFWRTLSIIEAGKDNTDRDFGGHPSEAHRRLANIYNKATSYNPVVVGQIAHIIEEHLQPDYSNFVEPEVNENVRGRPKGSRSTRREKSAWEPQSSSRGRSRKSNPTDSSTGLESGPSVKNYGSCGGVPLQTSPYIDNIPEAVHKYIEGVVDVAGDGNCGFRAVASFIYSDEDQYQYVRNSLVTELLARPRIYEPIYGGELDEAIQRISWDGGACLGSDRHWMQVYADLFTIASVYNVVIIYIGFNARFPTRTNLCVTVLPLYRASGVTRPSREICIGHTGPLQHFIRLNLCEGCPVPPIVPYWFRHRQPTVLGWEDAYTSRVNQWEHV